MITIMCRGSESAEFEEVTSGQQAAPTAPVEGGTNQDAEASPEGSEVRHRAVALCYLFDAIDKASKSPFMSCAKIHLETG